MRDISQPAAKAKDDRAAARKKKELNFCFTAFMEISSKKNNKNY
jgi:hypothetical protein